MDLNLLMSTVQLAVSLFQMKLDHYTKRSTSTVQFTSDAFYDLGEAIRTLEYALAETVAFVGQTDERAPNPRLATLWEDASNSIQRTDAGSDLAHLTFEKGLYWRNPQFFRGQSQKDLYRISLHNVLIQLRALRTKYDKIQSKMEY